MFCNAFILRTFPYSNSSLILKVFSEQHGVLSILAKGAKRLKSPYTAVLQILSEVKLDMAISAHSELHTLKTAEILHPDKNQQFLSTLTKNYALFSCISQDARWIESKLTLTPTDEGYKTHSELSENVSLNSFYPPLYKLFKEYLCNVSAQFNPELLSLVFKIRFIALLGTFPANALLKTTESIHNEILATLQLPWEELPNFTPSVATQNLLRNIINRERITQ